MEAVKHVHARDDYQLELEFDSGKTRIGETRIFDACPYLEKGAFTRLQDPTKSSSRHSWRMTPFAGRAISILPRKHSTTVLGRYESDMRLSYDPETGSLYIHLVGRPSTDSDDAYRGICCTGIYCANVRQ